MSYAVPAALKTLSATQAALQKAPKDRYGNVRMYEALQIARAIRPLCVPAAKIIDGIKCVNVCALFDSHIGDGWLNFPIEALCEFVNCWVRMMNASYIERGDDEEGSVRHTIVYDAHDKAKEDGKKICVYEYLS